MPAKKKPAPKKTNAPKKASQKQASQKKAGAKKKPVAKKAGAKKKPVAKRPKPVAKTKTIAAKTAAPPPAKVKAAAPVVKKLVEQAAPPPPPWSDAVKQHIAGASTGFAGTVRRLATGSAWSFAEGPELNGLEKWGKALALLDRRAGIRALVAAALFGFPKVIEAGGEAINDLGFLGKDEDTIHGADGAAVEVQLARAVRWLENPSESNRAAITSAYDRTRQLNVWDDDLLPSPQEQFYWYLEVGQCACAAILNDEKPGTEDSYYGWSPSTCIARGLVVAARGLRQPGADFDVVLDDMGRAIAAAFT